MYVSLGEYNQAKELHEKALMIRKGVLVKAGEDHADVATSYNNLASVFNRLGAKDLHEKALIIRKQIFGEYHVYVKNSSESVGIG